MDLKQQIRNSWLREAHGGGFPVPTDEELDYSRFLRGVQISNLRASKRHLRLEQQLLELEIYWLGVFHASTWRAVQDERLPKEWLGPCMLLATSCNYSLAVLRLTLLGLDGAARVVARSMNEALQYCLVMVADPAMATSFAVPETPVEACEFWYRHLSPSALNKRMNQIENDAFCGSPDLADEVRKWRRGDAAWLSEFVHPSYGATVTEAWSPTHRDPEALEIGIFGRSGPNSRSTLLTTIHGIWYFGCLLRAILQKSDGPKWGRKEDEIDRDAGILWKVVQEVVLENWDGHRPDGPVNPDC